MCVFCVIFFFFKQKTAYEMRISDWSSDVCSSDLAVWIYQSICLLAAAIKLSNVAVASLHQEALTAVNAPERRCWARCNGPWCAPLAPSGQVSEERSEEHTSELQSLMRISYAVFCLKKKKDTNISKTNISN